MRDEDEVRRGAGAPGLALGENGRETARAAESGHPRSRKNVNVHRRFEIDDEESGRAKRGTGPGRRVIIIGLPNEKRSTREGKMERES